jgi:hypothetical protein
MNKEILQTLEEQIPYIKILKEWFSEPDGSSLNGGHYGIENSN